MGYNHGELSAVVGLGDAPISVRKISLGRLVAATKAFQTQGEQKRRKSGNFISHEAVNVKVPMGRDGRLN